MIQSINKKIVNFFKTIFVKNKEQEFLQSVEKITKLVNFSNTMLFSDTVWVFNKNNWKGKYNFVFKERDLDLINEIRTICLKRNINLLVCEYGILFINIKDNLSKFIKTKNLRKIEIISKNIQNKPELEYDLKFQKYIHVICSMLIQEIDESSGLFIIANFQSTHKFLEALEKYSHFNVINIGAEFSKKAFPDDCYFIIFKDENFHFISQFPTDSYIVPWFYYGFKKNNTV